ncbi:MAG: UDP-N-acetylglucosamine 2-epimerase (non-hydrolyzing) [Deltaproteobacteria bacterium]|nr:UDP-N-acetylglucosamine 2-epimerase (non-hydrolyzing) [Deltaproteobacteria bacterium]
MSKVKVMVVFGTRPEAIKMAPVIAALRRKPEIFEAHIVVTGQHRQMLYQVLQLFDIDPDVDLSVMTEGQTPNTVASQVLMGMEEVFQDGRPDAILVQGDTTSAFAAAMAAFHHRILIGHVEAGLRTRHKYNPFPEEINRQLLSVLGDMHFAPTERARRNLMEEGISGEKVYVTGNTVIDAILWIRKDDYAFRHTILDRVDYMHKKVIVLTTHRRESFGKPMQDVLLAVKEVVKQHPEVDVVFPVHYNPNVRRAVEGTIKDCDRIHLIDPLDYESFVQLINKSYLILTDSGGIQEEAPSLGKPVLVLRETTERPEGIEAGTSRLVGTSPKAIIAGVHELLTDSVAYQRMATAKNPYGDGKASERIIDILLEHFAPKMDSGK